MLFRGNELAVRAPACLIEEAEIFFGQLALVTTIDVHHPDIVTTAPIGREGNPLAIG